MKSLIEGGRTPFPHSWFLTLVNLHCNSWLCRLWLPAATSICRAEENTHSGLEQWEVAVLACLGWLISQLFSNLMTPWQSIWELLNKNKAHKIQVKMLKFTGILYSGELVIIHDCILILCFQLDFGFKFSIFKFKFIATWLYNPKLNVEKKSDSQNVSPKKNWNHNIHVCSKGD